MQGAAVNAGLGVDPRPLFQSGTLRRLGLESRRYLLYVSRFEREGWGYQDITENEILANLII